MRQVSPSIYNKEYYENVCLGFEDYKKYKGNKLNSRWKDLLDIVDIKKNMKILDLGSGRGEVAFYLAKKGARVVGIDYSKDAIKIANNSLKSLGPSIKNRVSFKAMDATKMDFKDNEFDLIVSFDMFEHLYKEELEKVMGSLSKVLKKNGVLLVHTEQNKYYLDFTHKFYIYPLSSFLIWLNNLLSSNNYQGLPKDPRNEYHKKQHVNEPTIFYLNDLFKSHNFEGKIISNVGLVKPVLSWKDKLYNVMVCFWPLSNYFPLNILFATDYICLMRNKK